MASKNSTSGTSPGKPAKKAAAKAAAKPAVKAAAKPAAKAAAKPAAKAAAKAAAKPAVKAAAKKAPRKTAAAQVKAGVLGSGGFLAGKLSEDGLDLIHDLLGNVLYDLLKSGWHEAAPALAELIGRLPLLQFSRIARHNTGSQEAATPALYDEWMNSVLAVTLELRTRVAELEDLAKQTNTKHKEIAAFAAGYLIDTAGTGKTGHINELMFEMRAFFSHRDLSKTVPAAPAKAPRRRGPVL